MHDKDHPIRTQAEFVLVDLQEHLRLANLELRRLSEIVNDLLDQRDVAPAPSLRFGAQAILDEVFIMGERWVPEQSAPPKKPVTICLDGQPYTVDSFEVFEGHEKKAPGEPFMPGQGLSRFIHGIIVTESGSPTAGAWLTDLIYGEQDGHTITVSAGCVCTQYNKVQFVSFQDDDHGWKPPDIGTGKPCPIKRVTMTIHLHIGSMETSLVDDSEV